ncbi:hypothetical protein DP067_00475 [Mycoplasmopsis anatis]|uniref:DDE-type integrase/transposase/recombinase n=1 Tax=Mycoplasmopsis anatis TaxID=171279 RepID=UPI000DC6F219|nr:DDE-type integrase/transposase/recombinase [Mycoplasmopsis anatis]AWX69854.1 hypothetical protein DP067_00475 [Mycoplasmopsis anatis]
MCIRDKYCLVTVLDRKSRRLYSVRSLKTSLAVKKSLIKIIENNALKIKTLTIDNGSENVLLHEVINQNNLYKCDAYCSYQKGSIENIHRHIRRYIAKGISMDKFSQILKSVMTDSFGVLFYIKKQYNYKYWSTIVLQAL